ncbi:hypothetical protein [Bacillus kwashiorkori]|uniref:hypothetical protein n=1 Tax=Bacillus kwashiorkori TaxID=1522318 RepID=UPI000784F2DF|nr:hypothetical protein [Bacillus kwashiorkori]
MRNRYILALLCCGVLLYFALPRLSLKGNGMELYFSWFWLAFLLMAIAGNLYAVLYSPKKQKKMLQKQSVKKVRVYE